MSNPPPLSPGDFQMALDAMKLGNINIQITESEWGNNGNFVYRAIWEALDRCATPAPSHDAQSVDDAELDAAIKTMWASLNALRLEVDSSIVADLQTKLEPIVDAARAQSKQDAVHPLIQQAQSDGILSMLMKVQQECIALRVAGKALLAACHDADRRGELDSILDGELMDAMQRAIDNSPEQHAGTPRQDGVMIELIKARDGSKSYGECHARPTSCEAMGSSTQCDDSASPSPPTNRACLTVDKKDNYYVIGGYFNNPEMAEECRRQLINLRSNRAQVTGDMTTPIFVSYDATEGDGCSQPLYAGYSLEQAKSSFTDNVNASQFISAFIAGKRAGEWSRDWIGYPDHSGYWREWEYENAEKMEG